MNDVNVKLIAIAKDEGAYLAEWCAHHLYFGFDQIDVYINRTSDNSRDVLWRLSEVDSRVNVKSCDWVDWLPDRAARAMQKIIYSMAINEAEEQDFTHVALFDVDEFWVPVDCATNVQEFLATLPQSHSVQIPWATLIERRNRPFTRIESQLECGIHRGCKSIVSTHAPIKLMRLHHPEIECRSDDRRLGKVLPNGEEFSANSNNPQFMSESACNQTYNVYLVHRMFRSEIEYVSRLAKGLANAEVSGQLAANRRGYNVHPLGAFQIGLPQEEYDYYRSFVDSCVEEVDDNGAQGRAEEFVTGRWETAVTLLSDAVEVRPNVVARMLKGCRDDTILSIRRRALDVIDSAQADEGTD